MKTTTTSTSGSRILRVMKALKGHSLTGLSNGELANALNESPTNINRALNTLIEEGVATKLDNGRFALSIHMLQIVISHANEIDRAQTRIAELQQRVLAGSLN